MTPERWVRARRELRAGNVGGYAPLALGWLIGVGCEARVEEARRERPDLVIFIVLDTLAGAHVSHLGYDRETTPNIDRLAHDGVTFEQTITPASYTVASIPSLLTGRLPDRHGLTWYDRRLPQSEQTIAEMASAAGYQTFAAVAVQNGGPRYGNLQGFDEVCEVWLGPGPADAEAFEFKGRTVHMPSAAEFASILERQLDARAADEATFVYFHVLEPHDPYDPPVAFKQMFVDERFKGPYSEEREPSLHDLPRDRSPEEETVAAVEHLYDANILWADENFGRWVSALKERDCYDEALVVVTADHGEAFWEHGVRSHGFRLYEEEIRVPLIVKFPVSWQRAGRRVSSLVSTLDIVPSLCDWLSLNRAGPDLDGRSLESLVVDPDGPAVRDHVFLRARKDVHRFGLRLAEKKLIVHDPPDDKDALAVELYDLDADPGEQTDLSSARPDETRQLMDELERLRTELLTGESPPRAEHPELPEADRSLLEALGYGGGVEAPVRGSLGNE